MNYYQVEINQNQGQFAARMGFANVCGLSNLLLTFLTGVLKASKIEKPNDANYMNTQVCQVATYVESKEDKVKEFVSEETYNAFLDFRYEARDKVIEFASAYEKLGSNLLIQQLRYDVVGEASK